MNKPDREEPGFPSLEEVLEWRRLLAEPPEKIGGIEAPEMVGYCDDGIASGLRRTGGLAGLPDHGLDLTC